MEFSRKGCLVILGSTQRSSVAFRIAVQPSNVRLIVLDGKQTTHDDYTLQKCDFPILWCTLTSTHSRVDFCTAISRSIGRISLLSKQRLDLQLSAKSENHYNRRRFVALSRQPHALDFLTPFFRNRMNLSIYCVLVIRWILDQRVRL